jgi:hypothetical protein
LGEEEQNMGRMRRRREGRRTEEERREKELKTEERKNDWMEIREMRKGLERKRRKESII